MQDNTEELVRVALQRVRAEYPFGEIEMGEISYGCEAVISTDADLRRATGKGGIVAFAPNVGVLRGNNKTTCAGSGSVIAIGAGTTLENCLFTINGDDCAIIIGENCRLRGIKMPVVGKGSLIVIGSHSSWESGAIISQSGDIVVLGNDCMVSNDVVLRTSDGHTIFDAATKTAINGSQSLFVGHHVWLGNGCRVNKGAQVGSGSVVGQKSVASGRMDTNAIYAGMPARKVRDGVVWSRTPSYDDIPEEFLPKVEVVA